MTGPRFAFGPRPDWLPLEHRRMEFGRCTYDPVTGWVPDCVFVVRGDLSVWLEPLPPREVRVNGKVLLGARRLTSANEVEWEPTPDGKRGTGRLTGLTEDERVPLGALEVRPRKLDAPGANPKELRVIASHLIDSDTLLRRIDGWVERAARECARWWKQAGVAEADRVLATPDAATLQALSRGVNAHVRDSTDPVLLERADAIGQLAALGAWGKKSWLTLRNATPDHASLVAQATRSVLAAFDPALAAKEAQAQVADLLVLEDLERERGIRPPHAFLRLVAAPEHALLNGHVIGDLLPLMPTGSILGRASDCDLQLFAPGQGGRKNSRFAQTTDGTWEILHLGHSNPIVLNGQPMWKLARLAPGDRIEPGPGLVLEFVIVEDG